MTSLLIVGYKAFELGITDEKRASRSSKKTDQTGFAALMDEGLE